MNTTTDFKTAAYNINCILNGLTHQWCDGETPDVQNFKNNISDLQENFLPVLAGRDAALAESVRGTFAMVAEGKAGATPFVERVLNLLMTRIPELAEHRVDFSAYSLTLSANRARAYSGQPLRNPNIAA